MSTKASTKKAKPSSSPRTLPVEVDKDTSQERAIAEIAVHGVASNALMVRDFGKFTFGDALNLGECLAALRADIKAVHGGDLKTAEAMLVAQAAALNSMFAELARRSALNMGEYLNAAETYMRLALKTQAQCRATLETLATIKNPPVVFARQANINNGGQQQVNNGAASRVAEEKAQGEGGAQTLPAPDPETALDSTRRLFPAGMDSTNGAASLPVAAADEADPRTRGN